MKILWHSNAPFAGTGYGNQTDVFVPRFQRVGHEVKISAFYGLHGAALHVGDTQVLPGGKDSYGNDILFAHFDHHKPDAIIGLLDVWVLNPELLRRLPYYNWTPVDHDPCPPPVVGSAMAARGIIAMSRFGEKMLKQAGIKNLFYVPHGVDSKVFQPVDREDARRRLKIPQAAFLAVIVMANKGAPSRKAFSQNINAFAKLREAHPDAMLYLHTDLRGFNGEDIKRLIELAGIPDEAWRASNQYQLVQGMLGQDYLNMLYNSADVLLNASRGEGFGIPIIEAQMCGTPVITTDFSAMTELTGAGWATEPAERVYTGQQAYQAIPSTDAIYEALEKAYKLRGDEDFRKHARKFALKYDADKVLGKYWYPVLKDIEKQVKPEPKPLPVNVVSRKLDKTLHGVKLQIHENPNGGQSAEAFLEIVEHYGLDKIELQDGDWVLDLGANVGVVSCYLAQKFPKCRIVAVEPEPETFGFLLMNLHVNGCRNVKAVNKAISGDGRPVHLYSTVERNAGASSMFGGYENARKRLVGSTTVRALMAEHGIERVALLKFDVEGAEYELFNDAPLGQIDRVVGEVHRNETLNKRYDSESLRKMLQTGVTGSRLHIQDVPDFEPDGTPDLSIIIPTYNGAETIEKAVSTGLGLPFMDVQVVVCDDGSDDGTLDVLKKYKKDKRLVIAEHGENKGQHEAMRTATKAATGRYILFHGDDDWAGLGVVSLVMALDREAPDVAFAYGPQQYHGIRNDIVHPEPYDREKLNEHYYPLNGIIYRREVFTDHGCMWWNPPGMRTYPEDYDLILQVVGKGLRGMAVPGPHAVLHYTYAAGRQSDNRIKKDAEIMAAFYARWFPELAEKAG